MARRGHPVLYELLGSASASTSGANAAHASAPEGHALARQSIRVPIGWCWLAAVLALALIAIAYQFGRSAGDRAGFARGTELRSDGDAVAHLASQTPDPTRRAAPPSGGAIVTGSSRDSSRPVAGERAPSGATPAGGSQADGSKDLRVKGLNYWIVARTSAEEAGKMVAFISSNGLEVVAVPDNNPRFVRVVAIPGVPDGRSSEAARRQEAKIKSIGKLWKNAARGNRDFDDTYLELYR